MTKHFCSSVYITDEEAPTSLVDVVGRSLFWCNLARALAGSSHLVSVTLSCRHLLPMYAPSLPSSCSLEHTCSHTADTTPNHNLGFHFHRLWGQQSTQDPSSNGNGQVTLTGRVVLGRHYTLSPQISLWFLFRSHTGQHVNFWTKFHYRNKNVGSLFLQALNL